MRGEFWLAGKASVRRSGTLDVATGVLTLESEELVECMVVISRSQHTVTLTYRDDAEVRYSLLGVLEDGTLVSIPTANRGRCEHHGDRAEQEFLLLVALTGRHVDDQAQVYEAAHVAFPAIWVPVVSTAPWNGTVCLSYGESFEIEVDAGSLRLQFAAMTRSEIERRIVEPILTLLLLLSAQPEVPIGVQLTGADDQGVVSVQVERARKDPPPAQQLNMALPLHHLALSNLQAWYGLTRKVSPLTGVVARAITGRNVTLEIKVLSLAAAAEAFHRGVYGGRVLAKPEARRIRGMAVDAVPDGAKKRVEDALAHIGQATFAERLGQLLDTLDDWADDVAGSLIDRVKGAEPRGRELWIKSVKDARNGSAHLLPYYADDVVKYSSEMYVLFESLRWLMTAVVMQQVGVPMQVVRSSAEGTSSYHLFRGRAVLYWPSIYLPPTQNP